MDVVYLPELGEFYYTADADKRITELEYESKRRLLQSEDALKKLNLQQARIAELERLVRALLNNHPDDAAADGVTVYEVWLKEARKALEEE